MVEVSTCVPTSFFFANFSNPSSSPSKFLFATSGTGTQKSNLFAKRTLDSDSESDSEQEPEDEHKEVVAVQEREIQVPKLEEEEKCEEVKTQIATSGRRDDENPLLNFSNPSSSSSKSLFSTGETETQKLNLSKEMVNSESESDSEQELDTEYEDVSTLQEKEMQDPKLHKEEKCEKVETQSPASGHGSDEKGFDENSALIQASLSVLPPSKKEDAEVLSGETEDVDITEDGYSEEKSSASFEEQEELFLEERPLTVAIDPREQHPEVSCEGEELGGGKVVVSEGCPAEKTDMDESDQHVMEISTDDVMMSTATAEQDGFSPDVGVQVSETKEEKKAHLERKEIKDEQKRGIKPTPFDADSRLTRKARFPGLLTYLVNNGKVLFRKASRSKTARFLRWLRTQKCRGFTYDANSRILTHSRACLCIGTRTKANIVWEPTPDWVRQRYYK